MKIGQPNIGVANATPNPSTAVNKSFASAASNSSVPAGKTAGVSVSMSAQTRGLSQAQQNDAGIDMNKVLSIKAEIEKGTYKINAQAIADKLLSGAQEMLQSKPQ